MTRAELEAACWEQLTAMICQKITQGDFIDAILNAAEDYAATLQPHTPRRALHHTSGTDLYPVIGALAEALGLTTTWRYQGKDHTP